ncbi:MAG: hypothetical protein AAF318_01145 [Pseudomonadota bacterium]
MFLLPALLIYALFTPLPVARTIHNSAYLIVPTNRQGESPSSSPTANS